MRRYLAVFFGTFFCLLLIPVFLNVYSQNISGDLTRVGGYSERDYGWNKPQPVVKLPSDEAIGNDADIVLLGDSFSAWHVWQSVLMERTGMKIRTFHYGGVGCVDNWLITALQSGAQTVMIEVVERDFVPKFKSIAPCAASVPKPHVIQGGSTAAERTNFPPDFNLEHAIKATARSVRMDPKRVRIEAPAMNALLVDHCAAFSHRAANRLLYFGGDEVKFTWTEREVNQAAANLKAIQDRVEQKGKRFVFVVIPDKLSVYAECLAEKPSGPDGFVDIDIVKELARRGVKAPDLFPAFRSERNKTVDLYLPNDTHLSTSGYILLADQLAGHLSGRH